MISKIFKTLEASALGTGSVAVLSPAPAPDSKLQIKTEIEIEKNKISEISFEKQVCRNCGGSERWQPKKSNQWKCVSCDPPASQSMVARFAPERTPGESSPGRPIEPADAASDAITNRWGPWTICYQKPMCPTCHSSHVTDTQILETVHRTCPTCRHVYTDAEFWSAHDRPIEIKSWTWNRNVSRN